MSREVDENTALFPVEKFWFWAGTAAVSVFFYPILLYFVSSTLALFAHQEFHLPKSLGELGDAYGSANAIVSAVAFVALVWTLLLQRKDIETQQKMLEQSITEMNRTAESTLQLAQSQHVANQLASIQLERELVQQISELQKNMDWNHFQDNASFYIELFSLKARKLQVTKKLEELGIESVSKSNCPDAFFKSAIAFAQKWNQRRLKQSDCDGMIQLLSSFGYSVNLRTLNDEMSICRVIRNAMDQL